MSPSAAKLKEEGNALFSGRKYLEASAKYSAAIELDDENAILYANRAACWLNLRKYFHAVLDATMATELDPAYPKGHIRLATARDEKSKREIIAALASSTKKLETYNPKNIPAEWRGTPRFPIIQHCALAMMPELEENENCDSCASAWYISDAYLRFEKSITIMNAYQTRPEHMKVVPNAIYYFSEALLRDARVFRGGDSRHNWDRYLDKQMSEELEYYRAWDEDSTADTLIKEAPTRLAAEGWDVLRPALDATIRAWVVRGHLMGCTRVSEYDVEKEYQSRAVEVIRWGREVWANVDPDVRGEIFDLEYYHAVYKLYLDSIVKGYGIEKDAQAKEERGKEVVDVAEELIESVESVGIPNYKEGPSDVYAFYANPWSTALMAKGVIMGQKAHSATDSLDAMSGFGYGGAHIMRSTLTIPQDDIAYAYRIGVALLHIWSAPAVVAQYFVLFEKFKTSFEKSKPIWGETHWVRTVGGEIKIVKEQATPMEEKLKRRIECGELAKHDLLNNGIQLERISVPEDMALNLVEKFESLSV